MDTNDREARILFLGMQIAQSEIQAKWWITYATTEDNKKRSIKKGDHDLTHDELVMEALKTAKIHMHRMTELAELRDKLIRGDTND